jgi:hypothetical protein
MYFVICKGIQKIHFIFIYFYESTILQGGKMPTDCKELINQRDKNKTQVTNIIHLFLCLRDNTTFIEKNPLPLL